MRNVTVAATQISCDWNREQVLHNAEALVREAAQKGANIILLQELFETPYFCQTQDFEHMKLATTLETNKAVHYFQPIARELGVVLPISFLKNRETPPSTLSPYLTQTEPSLARIEKPIFRTVCPMRKNFILPPEIPALKSGKPVLAP